MTKVVVNNSRAVRKVGKINSSKAVNPVRVAS